MNGQVLHSISQERLELVQTLGPYMESQVGRQTAVLLGYCMALLSACAALLVWQAPCVINMSFPCCGQTVCCSCGLKCLIILLQVLPLLRDPTKSWQPSDFLPESSDPDFLDKVRHSSSSKGSCSSLYLAGHSQDTANQCLIKHTYGRCGQVAGAVRGAAMFPASWQKLTGQHRDAWTHMLRPQPLLWI